MTLMHGDEALPMFFSFHMTDECGMVRRPWVHASESTSAVHCWLSWKLPYYATACVHPIWSIPRTRQSSECIAIPYSTSLVFIVTVGWAGRLLETHDKIDDCCGSHGPSLTRMLSLSALTWETQRLRSCKESKKR